MNYLPESLHSAGVTVVRRLGVSFHGQNGLILRGGGGIKRERFMFPWKAGPLTPLAPELKR